MLAGTRLVAVGDLELAALLLDSLNRRTFSTAIGAWSAKVLSRLTCACENSLTSRRQRKIARESLAHQSTTSTVRKPNFSTGSRARCGTVPSSGTMSSMCTTAAVDHRAARDVARSSGSRSAAPGWAFLAL